jgi:hypothetical protein
MIFFSIYAILMPHGLLPHSCFRWFLPFFVIDGFFPFSFLFLPSSMDGQHSVTIFMLRFFSVWLGCFLSFFLSVMVGCDVKGDVGEWFFVT